MAGTTQHHIAFGVALPQKFVLQKLIPLFVNYNNKFSKFVSTAYTLFLLAYKYILKIYYCYLLVCVLYFNLCFVLQYNLPDCNVIVNFIGFLTNSKRRYFFFSGLNFEQIYLFFVPAL